MACPRCGEQQVRKNGRDRRGAQVYECRVCRRSFTPLTATPFASYLFPPDIIALAVRWYLRYCLSFADIAELLAERGCMSTVPRFICGCSASRRSIRRLPAPIAARWAACGAPMKPM